jgi:hypothetical protein
MTKNARRLDSIADEIHALKRAECPTNMLDAVADFLKAVAAKTKTKPAET